MKTIDKAILPDVATTEWCYHTAFHAYTPRGETALHTIPRELVATYTSTGKSLLIHRKNVAKALGHLKLEGIVPFAQPEQTPFFE